MFYYLYIKVILELLINILEFESLITTRLIKIVVT